MSWTTKTINACTNVNNRTKWFVWFDDNRRFSPTALIPADGCVVVDTREKKLVNDGIRSKMASPLRCLIIPGILIFINLPSTYQQEVFQLTMKNATAAPGGTSYFDVQVVAGVTGDGEWSKDGTPLSPVQGKLIISVTDLYRQLFVFGVAASDGGRYTYTIQGRSTSAYLIVGASGPVDGNWGQWTQWSSPSCPATCGPTARGPVYRSRTCTNPAPSSGGASCPGQSSQSDTQECGPTTCAPAVNGNWGQWTQWSGSTCPATCGPTARRPVSRSRTCTDPAPSNGGTPCPGQSSQSETRECGPATCVTSIFARQLLDVTKSVGGQVIFQVDLTQSGVTGVWTKDGVTITADANHQLVTSGNAQILFISGLQVSDSGQYSFTANGETTSAQLTVQGSNTPVNGNWSQWTQWSGPSCPATCGPTARRSLSRSRTCTNPAPINGGASCPGQSSQNDTQECGPTTCGTIESGLRNISVPVGQAVVLQVIVSQPGLAGAWQRDGVRITGGSRYQISSSGKNHNFFISNAQVSDSGRYTLTVSGDVTSAWLTVSGAVNGNWGAWTQWSSPPCPASCGPTARHTVTRSRSCDNPAPSNGGATCPGQPGQSNEVECGPSTCGDGGVSEWSNWSNPSCPATCGRAVFHTQRRSRTCNSGSTCTQSLEETRTVICMDSFCPVDGGLTQWSMWTTTTPCTETCGPDVMKTLIRTRTCTNPAPSFGGSNCVGDTQQTSQENCNLPVCGAIQSQLQSQSAVPGGAVVFEATLNQDNAVGYWQKNGNTLTTSPKTLIESIGRTQRLTISNVQASDVGNYSFVVNGETTTAALTLRSTTPVDGGFSVWGMWTSGQCSVTCGDGMTTDTRRRTCTSPSPQNGGQPCSGPTSETRTTPCTMTCTVNGGYTLWSDWVRGSCSGSCDRGTQTDTRTRSCTNPRPQNGGLQCSGLDSETRTSSCIMPGCEVDGGETEWVPWVNRSCSATCGKGATRTTDRHRNCTNPEPKNGGRACVLHLYESKVVNCGLGDCPSTGKNSSFTLERDGLYIGLIAAIIAIGVCLIIIIVACCLWNCRKDAKAHHYADKMNSFELESISRSQPDYVPRGKYMDPSFNGAVRS
ncbi:A disintegrin and metalloproteinase with thrombospondin motifs adt-1-like isoform X1 [Haliotis cracherodii]|uniref:A disintegrin and metalloproteinase with thrombospondin motifs adt-1-like isoform X1 n=1 Tax=Haliotis cracherodii TaxID=6455 RepID=UPI0039E8B310